MKIILADESVDFNVVRWLRREEEVFEIQTIIETTPGISDEEVLKAANDLEAILLTEDSDFGELVFRLQIPNHGIIFLRMGGERVEDKINRLQLLFENYRDQLADSFSVVTIQKIRVIPQHPNDSDNDET